MADRIVLGSGKIYVAEAVFTDGVCAIPTHGALETSANLLGYIQGGATLAYNPSYYEAKDDSGVIAKKFITNEEAILKSGILTWNSDTLDKLCQTATVTALSSTVNQVKIGGTGNYDNTDYVIRFLHEDEDGDIRLTIVGSNEAGFEMAFAKDKETVINAEFKARPQDTSGTLIIYEEEV